MPQTHVGQRAPDMENTTTAKVTTPLSRPAAHHFGGGLPEKPSVRAWREHSPARKGNNNGRLSTGRVVCLVYHALLCLTASPVSANSLFAWPLPRCYSDDKLRVLVPLLLYT
jgi:hypothetical protein